jgi:hypothetical protein
MSDETKLKAGLRGMCKTELELSFEPYSDLTSRKIINN